MYTQAADGSGSLQGVWFGELLQLTGAEGLLLAVSVDLLSKMNGSYTNRCRRNHWKRSNVALCP